MRSRISAFAALLAAALTVFSCEEPIVIPGTETVDALTAEVTNVGLTSFDVVVKAPEASPYVIECYKEAEFEGITMESIAKRINERTAMGVAWSSFLKAGSQTITFPSLYTDSSYKIILFGMNAAGETTSEPIILSATTGSFSAKVTLEESTPFTFSVNVNPSRDDIGWFGVAFTGSKSRLETIDEDMLLTYIRLDIGQSYSYGASYEEITKVGAGSVNGECNPDDAILFAVVALDRDFKVVSGISRLIFEPSQEGFRVFDEKRTEHLHSLIYAYDHKEIGVLLELTGYDSRHPGYPTNTISFNGDSKNFYGVDFYRASDKECGDALAAYIQYLFKLYVTNPENTSYFQNCIIPEDFMDVIWYDTKNQYETSGMRKIWERIPVAQVTAEKGTPDEMAFAIAINGISSDFKIYAQEVCVSRCSFAAEGYSFDLTDTNAAATKAGGHSMRPRSIDSCIRPPFARQ